MVQALYLDQQHPELSLENKLCVLTEISDKREYFVSQLIGRLSMGHKDYVRKLYKELSVSAHPSHLDFPTVEEMKDYLMKSESSIDCDKVAEVVSLTLRTYDAIFYLTLQIFPGARRAVQAQADIVEMIGKHNLPLLRKK